MAWRASSPSALNYATLNFLNIGAVFLIGIELGRINGIKSLFPGLLAVICFICVTPTTVEMLVDGEMHVVKDVLLRQFSDTRSLFLGMFIAILSVEIYCWLENRKGLKIRMPDTVPPNVAASFSALIPAIITTTAIATLGFVFHQLTGMYLYDAVYQVVQQPLERVVQSLPGILLLAAGMGALCAWLGLSLSWAISLPAGPAIVLTASALFFVSLFFGTRSRLLVGWRTLMG